jgi:carboxypeptidase T
MKRATYIIILGLLLSIGISEEKMVIRFDNPTKILMQEFSDENIDVAAYKSDEYLDIVVTEAQYDELLSQGYQFRITQYESQLLENMGDARDIPGYRNYEELVSELQTIEMQNPGLCKLYDIGETLGKEYSNDGNSNYDDYHHEVWALKISDNVEIEEDEPSIFYLGEHHAREPISLEVVMSNINYILANYGVDPTITTNINNSQVWFVPLVNPNGHRIVTEQIDVWWRKNIRDNNENGSFDTSNNTGYGIDGVDPNRNYGFEWGPVGTSDDFNSPVYHGTEAWSEPEVDAIRNLMESHHFVTGISYHSYSELVLFPFGYQYGVTAPDHDALEELAVEMASTIEGQYGGNYTPQQSLELYPCMGTTDDYAYGVHGTFSFTIELATEFIPPESEIDGICENNLDAAMILLDRVNHKTLTGHVTDATTGQPIIAEVFIEGIDDIGNFKYPYISDENFGRYYRLLQTGNYNVTFSAYGYLSQTFESVNINNQGQTNLDVALESAEITELSGVITNSQTGNPINGAVVELINTGIESTMCNSLGEYSFANLYEGNYNIRIAFDGMATIVQDIEVPPTTHNFMMIYSDIESFEGGISDEWTFGGYEDWELTSSEYYDGVFSATSGDIVDYQNSAIITNRDIEIDGEISFYIKVSSEAGYDYLKFYIDGTLFEQWAGEVDWTFVSFPITAGNHTFKWDYVKDSYVSDGQDCAWIDYVEFPTSVEYPIIDVSIDEIIINVEEGTIVYWESSFVINNIGLYPLEFSITGNNLMEDFDFAPQSGTIQPSQSRQIGLMFLGGLTAGIYDGGNLVINSNDLTNSPIEIPIEYIVTSDGIEVEVDLQENWNLVGLPVNVGSPNYQDIYPNAIENTLYAFDTNEGYSLQTELELGVGYWLKNSQTETISIAGDEVNNFTIPLFEGWNLISGLTLEINISQIQDENSIIVPNTIYGFFNNSYQNSETILPGYAYWIRANDNGEITLNIDNNSERVIRLNSKSKINNLK